MKQKVLRMMFCAGFHFVLYCMNRMHTLGPRDLAVISRFINGFKDAMNKFMKEGN